MAASATASTIFLRRYVMVISALSVVLCLFDERDCAHAEIVLTSVFAVNALGDEARERSEDLSRVPVAVEARHEEADPADDLVARVRSRALDASVNREQQLLF